ncbi:uncharacterized protein LOC141633444 isoform X2 [Silene latifolia]|uniref:uncharacterized protein LOC141633444 isoform X2 n=1 Tax=Silene latifolia TaxID=37657 RepID=UPI003D787D48
MKLSAYNMKHSMSGFENMEMAKARNLNISRRRSNQEERRNVEGDNQVQVQNYANISTDSESTEHYQDQNCEDGPNTQQRTEGRTYEYVVQDPDGKRTRGKTVLADIWNLPEGHRVVVEINKSNQPIGDEGRVLGYFCGTIERNGGLCSLSYTKWDHLNKGNKRNNQTLIINEVQEKSRKSKLSHKKAKTKPTYIWYEESCTHL